METIRRNLISNKWIIKLPNIESINSKDKGFIEYYNHKEIEFKFIVKSKLYESIYDIKENEYTNLSECISDDLMKNEYRQKNKMKIDQLALEKVNHFIHQRYSFVNEDPLGKILSKIIPLNTLNSKNSIKMK